MMAPFIVFQDPPLSTFSKRRDKISQLHSSGPLCSAPLKRREARPEGNYTLNMKRQDEMIMEACMVWADDSNMEEAWCWTNHPGCKGLGSSTYVTIQKIH